MEVQIQIVSSGNVENGHRRIHLDNTSPFRMSKSIPIEYLSGNDSTSGASKMPAISRSSTNLKLLGASSTQ